MRMTTSRPTTWLAAPLVLLATLTACSEDPVVCSAVGYVYDGPAVLDFVDPPAPEAVVRVCFGRDCVPQPVPGSTTDGWSVEQTEPWLERMQVPGVPVLRVVVESEGRTLHDAVHEIPTRSTTADSARCPGPYEFEPLRIAI